MKVKNGFIKKSVAVILFALTVLPLHAVVPTCIFNFDYRFMPSENAGPLGTPWVVAMFNDTLDGVTLTVENTSPFGTNVVQKLWFNLNPVLDPASLRFNFVGSSSGSDDWLISAGADQYKADGDGLYDILFVQTGVQPFGPGDWFVYNISGIPNLSASDFCYFSAVPPQGEGPYYGPFKAVALFPCFQYIAVPEPDSMAIVAIGLGMLLARQFRGRKSRVQNKSF